MFGDCHLVRYFVTQAAFSCANCLKNKDMDEKRCELELVTVKGIIAREEFIVELAEKDANSSGYLGK